MSARVAIAVALGLLLSSCGLRPRPTTVPVRVMWDEGEPQAAAQQLTIMLPGRLGRLPQYRNWGFFDLLTNARPETDAVAADLHFGYYRDKTFKQRIGDDLIRPARARGVEVVELLGISLGGFGALAYTIENPGAVERIILLAPFLGEQAIIDEIEAAGGLSRWAPGEIGDDDFQRRLWAGLTRRLVTESGRELPEIWLGYASGDRFARANRLLGRHLPPGSRVFTVPGGHDWPEWHQLYTAMLRGAE